MFINEMLKLERPICVIYVTGLDLFNDCHGMKGMQQSPWNGVAVVYRFGGQEHLIQSMHSLTSEKLYYVRDDSPDNQTEALNQISSTQIRQMMKNGQSCEHLTYSSVLNYLKMISI
jgi:nicotinic acid mononucleotide adenylyltransferase